MRALLLAALTLLAAVPIASALVATECVEGGNVVAPNVSWSPPCVRIASGDVVTWTNAHTLVHNVRSTQDDAAVFRALAPQCIATDNIPAGGSRTIRFTHDSDGVDASMRNPDGTWGPVVDCDLAVSPLSIGVDAIIPYKCGIHPSMTGEIRIQSVA